MAKVVFVARDAEERVVRAVVRAATERSLSLVYVERMDQLGRACGIAVGAAAAAIVEE